MVLHVWSRVPLKWSAPLVLAAAVVLAVASIGALAYWQGRTVATDLASRTVAQVHGRIADRLTALLDGPVRWNRQVVDLVRRGRLSTTQMDAWRQTLFDQSASFDPAIAGVCFGDASAGRTAWVFRYEGDDFHQWGRRDASTDWALHEARLTDDGSIDPAFEASVSAYDPRVRPWYTMAAEAGYALWGEPYVWMTGGALIDSLGLPYMSPVYDAGGALLGVVDVELGLRELSAFLSRLKTTERGLAFVMDREGRLVATSSGARLAVDNEAGGMDRVPATQSNDPKIARVSGWLTIEARRAVEPRASDSTEADVSAEVEDVPAPTEGLEVSAASSEVSEEPVSAGLKVWPPTFDGRLVVGDEPQIVRMTRFTHEQGLEWLIVTVVPEAAVMSGVDAVRRRGLAMAGVAVLATLLMGMGIAAWLVRPLIRVGEHVHRIGEGDLDTELELRHSPEVAALCGEINGMTAGLRDRLAMRKSLAMAMEVQQNLLPDEEPDLPGLDLAGHSIYCDETGGDYYDFLEITAGDEGLGVSVVVGDVMGHGIAAAMLMATARGVLRSRSRRPGTLADLMNHLNEMLVEVTGGKRFMTMLMLNVEPGSQTVRWASAGHDVPFVYDPVKDEFLDLGDEDGGLPLGVADFERYEEYELRGLPAGSILVGSTDGMWESRNDAGEMHGKEALMEIIRRHRDDSARVIADAMHDALSAFRGGAPQEDDETYVVVKLVDSGNPRESQTTS